MSELVLENKSLPKGWIFGKIKDVTDVIRGASPRPKGDPRFFGGDIPWIMIRDVSKEKGKFISKTKDTVTEEGAKKSRFLKKGSLILSNSGTVCVPKILQVDGCIHDGFLTFPDVPKNMNIDYLYYWFEKIRAKIRQENQQGVTQVNLNIAIVSDIDIPVPPLNEQKRIVEKIEEIFSNLDHTKSILDTVKLQLVEYHESFLKSLFEGKLTKKWRDENETNLKSLLEKIEVGRKNQDKKLQDIELKTIDGFFMIPPEWMWIKVGIISKNIQYGTSEKATTTKSKIPVLRMGNIQDGELSFDNLKYYPNNWKNTKQFLLNVGDVLFNRTNSAELVGKTAVYKENHPVAVFAGYLVRVKIIDETYQPLLLSWYINSIFGKSYIKTVVTQQVGQANVNATKLSMLPIPLMSFEEQCEISSELEMAFSLIKNTESITNSMLMKLDTLRSTLLKQAFEGKLVRQDPKDEPAEILLQKIKLEKEQLKQKQKTSRRSKNVK